MTNALPARKDSRVCETVLSPVAPQGFPGQTNLIDFGFDGFPDPLRAAPGLELLKSATFFIDAANAKTGDAYAFNQGTGGFALDARYGSSPAIGAADTNDPLLLPWTGTNHLYLPGVAGNYASAPDSAALDITGDIEIVVRVAMDDWTPTADQVIAGKWQAGAYSWHFRVSATGQFRMLVSSDGISTTDNQATGVPSPALVNGSSYWIRARYTVSNRTLVVGYSLDAGQAEPSVYSDTVTSAGGASVSVFASTSILEIGSVEVGSVLLLAGRIYRAIVRNGIGGTTVFDANFTTGITTGAQTTFTESSSNAATVTINRSTAGRKSVAVTRPVWLLGTDDYMEVADNDLLDFGATNSFSVVAVVRQWTTPTVSGMYMAKGAAPAGRWGLYNPVANQPQTFLNDGTLSTGVGVADYGTGPAATRVMIGVTDRGANTATLNTNNTDTHTASLTGVGSFANAAPMQIGGRNGVQFQDFELLAVAVFRRALSAAEIATINTYYGTA